MVCEGLEPAYLTYIGILCSATLSSQFELQRMRDGEVTCDADGEKAILPSFGRSRFVAVSSSLKPHHCATKLAMPVRKRWLNADVTL